MATQLDYSRVTRPQVGNNPATSRLDKSNPLNKAQDAINVTHNIFSKPITVNFMAMMCVAGIYDVLGLFLNETPGVGIAISILSDLTFIPWFYFSGIQFNGKRIGSMTATSILEDIPLVGNLPLIMVNVAYSYYSK